MSSDYMRISFFEEFPTDDNLRKLDMISFPTKLYVAAHSLNEFNVIRKKIKSKHVKEVVYWPILTKKEGYWISPFSSGNALRRVFGELEESAISVMLDLELPTRQNPLLYLSQGVFFFRNKARIWKFIREYQGKLYLAEYYPQGRLQEKLLKLFGLHYDLSKVFVMKMLYRSLHHFSDDFLKMALKKGVGNLRERFIVGVGTIARGIHGTERILSAVQLEQDLRIASCEGVQEVVVFRLGGLEEKYVRVIKKKT